jgi:hypothetical protein
VAATADRHLRERVAERVPASDQASEAARQLATVELLASRFVGSSGEFLPFVSSYLCFLKCA